MLSRPDALGDLIMSPTLNYNRSGTLPQDFRIPTIPGRSKSDVFLQHIGEGGVVLDFGCGVGRWADAMHLARPDITFHAIDKEMEKLSRHFEGKDWVEERIDMRFQDFRANGRQYDGIWAHSSLYQLKNDELPPVLREMAEALKPGAPLTLNFMEDSPAGRKIGYYGMPQEKLAALLKKFGLVVDEIKPDSGAACFGIDTIPTYLINAHKT